MHVTVFGATGRLGREILWAAPDRGFTVTAHARRLMSDSEPGIEWATGDAGSTVKGADAVLVVFGPRTPSDVPFCATETEQILSAMRQHGVTRFLCVTGAMVGDYPKNRTWCFQLLATWIQWRFQRSMEDRSRQEMLIRSSEINWTVFKPPRLTSGNSGGRIMAGPAIRVGMLSSIARADLAAAMIKEAEQGRFIGQCVFVKSAH